MSLWFPLSFSLLSPNVLFGCVFDLIVSLCLFCLHFTLSISSWFSHIFPLQSGAAVPDLSLTALVATLQRTPSEKEIYRQSLKIFEVVKG